MNSEVGETTGNPDTAHSGAEWSWEEWIQRLESAAASVRLGGDEDPPHLFKLGQVVTGAENLGWALCLDGRTISMTRQWEDSTVLLHTSADTAQAVASGRLGVADAIGRGEIKVSGDISAMLQALPYINKAQEALAQAMAGPEALGR